MTSTGDDVVVAQMRAHLDDCAARNAGRPGGCYGPEFETAAVRYLMAARLLTHLHLQGLGGTAEARLLAAALDVVYTSVRDAGDGRHLHVVLPESTWRRILKVTDPDPAAAAPTGGGWQGALDTLGRTVGEYERAAQEANKLCVPVTLPARDVLSLAAKAGAQGRDYTAVGLAAIAGLAGGADNPDADVEVSFAFAQSIARDMAADNAAANTPH